MLDRVVLTHGRYNSYTARSFVPIIVFNLAKGLRLRLGVRSEDKQCAKGMRKVPTKLSSTPKRPSSL